MADDAANVVQYACFCPLGDACSKRGKRLGTFPDEESARTRIKEHLVSSSYHYMSEEDALDMSNSCDTIEVVEEPVWQQPASDDQSWSSWRPAPYESKGKGKSSKGGGKAKGSGGGGKQQFASTMPGSFSAPLQVVPHAGSVPAVQLRLEQQAIRCEAAARQAARFARQAAAAFDEEAVVLRDLVDEIRRAA